MEATAIARGQATMLEIIAFHLGDQQFCIKTTSIRANQIQPVPDLGTSFDPTFSHGIIPLEHGLDHMFERFEDGAHAA
ncbi:hypothetical protein [Rhizobium sp. SL42]|uniref:hypothetical protein n=1 Tax=Rhizobium sp. SL42 TaxID=2806346 RepID=UPI001F4267CE|nr:hypothetical protein [Rhizobium sp. SL42]UJW77765.1 hypothetical protein IM739_22940 [Rhizobium sp. SL42]